MEIDNLSKAQKVAKYEYVAREVIHPDRFMTGWIRSPELIKSKVRETRSTDVARSRPGRAKESNCGSLWSYGQAHGLGRHWIRPREGILGEAHHLWRFDRGEIPLECEPNSVHRSCGVVRPAGMGIFRADFLHIRQSRRAACHARVFVGVCGFGRWWTIIPHRARSFVMPSFPVAWCRSTPHSIAVPPRCRGKLDA